LELQNTLIHGSDLQLISPTRKFVQEGNISYLDDKKKPKNGTYYLFNDILLFAKKEGKKLHLKGNIKLVSCTTRIVPGGIHPTLKLPAFELMTPTLGYPLALGFDTESERSKVLELIEESIAHLTSTEKNLQQRVARDTMRDTSDQTDEPTPETEEQEWIQFNCQYYDERELQIPRANLTFEYLIEMLGSTFEVEEFTLMINEYFVANDEDLQNILADQSSSYSVALYDPIE